MKYFALFTALIILLYLLGFIEKTSNSDFKWMDRNSTTALKGCAILTVIWAHIGVNLEFMVFNLFLALELPYF